MRNFFIPAILTIIFSGCIIFPDNQRQVWFGSLQRTHQSQSENVIRVYFDKMGNLYPAKEIYIPYRTFFSIPNSSDTYKEKFAAGNLEEYFLRDTNAFNRLAKFYNTSSENTNEGFRKIEETIFHKIINNINENLQKSASGTLVVFIHGFNETDPTGDYEELRNKIEECGFTNCKSYVYLEVYWDGLTANQADPSKMRIWARAQNNSANVNIGLRKILNGIGDNNKIRIITHSLGAGVATGALFNTSEKWHHNNKGYDSSATKISVPAQKDIRLGMIAPAIPGVTTFLDFNRRTPADITSKENNISKIIVGINKRDFALTKNFFGRDHAGIFGSTALGCDYDDEVDKTRKVFIERLDYSPHATDELFQCVDFSNKTINEKEHGLYYYLLLNEQIKTFLHKVFD